MELLFERERDAYLKYFNLTKKAFTIRRLKVLLVIIALYAVVLYMNNDKVWLYALFPVVALIGYKLPYYELLRIVDKQDFVKEQMFPTFLRYFISLIETQGNVYQTLKAVVPYTEEPLRTKLIELIKNLESDDVENYDAFIEFADFVGSSEAHMIMGMINEFNEEGIKKAELDELENTIKRLQENKINEIIEYKVNSVDRHSTPILVYALAYVMIFTFILIISFFRDIPI